MTEQKPTILIIDNISAAGDISAAYCSCGHWVAHYGGVPLRAEPTIHFQDPKLNKVQGLIVLGCPKLTDDAFHQRGYRMSARFAPENASAMDKQIIILQKAREHIPVLALGNGMHLWALSMDCTLSRNRDSDAQVTSQRINIRYATTAKSVARDAHISDVPVNHYSVDQLGPNVETGGDISGTRSAVILESRKSDYLNMGVALETDSLLAISSDKSPFAALCIQALVADTKSLAYV